MIRRVAAEGAALLLLALACAWASNAVAGPGRHLSWFPKQVRNITAPANTPALEPPKADLAAIPQPPQPATPPAPPKVEARKGAPPPAPPPKTDPMTELRMRFPPLTDAPMAEIGGDDALWLHGQGALFVDARRTALWAQGHVRGAKVVSVWEDGLAEKVEQLAMFTPDLKLPVVLYCTGGDCRDSHLLGQKLWLAGFRNLRIYTGGYPDWEARRGPISKGEAP